MKKYFVTCREALESKLLLQVCMRHGSAFVVGSVIVGGNGYLAITFTHREAKLQRTLENCSQNNLVWFWRKRLTK